MIRTLEIFGAFTSQLVVMVTLKLNQAVKKINRLVKVLTGWLKSRGAGRALVRLNLNFPPKKYWLLIG